jgi:class 3 adenylate cyclase
MARVRYARTADGAGIAYAIEGSGPPLFIARPLLRPAVIDELESEFETGTLELAARRSVVLWDWRGFGLSSAASPRYTLESSLLDLEAVVEASGFERFDLLAQLTPCHTAIAYDARNAGRVRSLILRNPGAPGGSPRTTTFHGIPDLVSTNFREYIQLAALRIFGWRRGALAERWQDAILRQFNGESWKKLMDDMEKVDATAEMPLVRARTLVVVDTGASGQSATVPPASQRVMRDMAAALPKAELVIVKGGSEAAYIEAVEEFLGNESAAVTARPEAHGTAIIMFTDIVDSVAHTERLGDAAFRDRSRTLDQRLRAAIRESHGAPIDGKVLGDGVLATFASARDAVAAARRCVQLSEELELPLHVGLHAGDVMREGDNVYGGAVNIASRVCGLSKAGEILVTDMVRGLARTSAGVAFEDLGEHALKGIDEPQRVYRVFSEGA